MIPLTFWLTAWCAGKSNSIWETMIWYFYLFLKCSAVHFFYSFKLLFSFGHLFGNKHKLDPEESWNKQAIIEERWTVNTQSYMRNESTIQNGNWISPGWRGRETGWQAGQLHTYVIPAVWTHLYTLVGYYVCQLRSKANCPCSHISHFRQWNENRANGTKKYSGSMNASNPFRRQCPKYQRSLAQYHF